ncbi:MAG: HigA family addiction module antidote protein [Acidobacteriaceae bacterium]|nr:HigA family addiction module antidote protein [Acidobacteriaceae bacterium]MBV9296987.1 HigA family addiction module antidote protein [Acidobacteriaceae bacterium]MBV9765605.1 HigA family addiction module antidote protein [Acidobacteriaceae bacterium]
MSIERPDKGWNVRRKPIHPGEMLREEFMRPLGLSASGLATKLRVPAARISELVNERRGISPDTALRLERYFGTSAEFWLNLQNTYNLLTARQAKATKIASEVRPRGNAA